MKRILILLPIISILVSCSLTKEASEENNEVVIIVDGLAYSERFYHEYGKDKYKKLNLKYNFSDGFVTQAQVDILKTELEKNNLKIIKT